MVQSHHKALLIAAFLLAFIGLWFSSLRYRITHCDIYPDSASLYFGLGPLLPMRTIGFSDQGKWMEVGTGSGMNMSVDWRHVQAIHIRSVDSDATMKIIAIRFDPEVAARQNPFEFGLADDQCISRLREKYERDFKFVIEPAA